MSRGRSHRLRNPNRKRIIERQAQAVEAAVTYVTVTSRMGDGAETAAGGGRRRRARVGKLQLTS